MLYHPRYLCAAQCDFDIAGSYLPMVADAEVITVAKEILSALPIGTFVIKLNHRVLLDAVFELCGVPSDKFRTIGSAVSCVTVCASYQSRRRRLSCFFVGLAHLKKK